MAQIRDILHRRTDLSTFVVHLTRNVDSSSAQDALVGIAASGRLEARSPFGWAKAQDDPTDTTRQSQRAVCFSETPLEHVNLMLGQIEGRSVQLEPYGVALTKLGARKLGINPIWYIDQTPGRDWVLANTLDYLRDLAVSNAHAGGLNFHEYYVARLFPFIDQMGTWPSLGSQKEFWWEREWRHLGHLNLPTSGVIWLCPEREIDTVNKRVGRELQPWLDPRWGLEQIVAHLAGFQPEDVSPFVSPEPETPAAGPIPF